MIERVRRGLLLAAFCATLSLSLLLTGCGGSGRAAVQGTVNLNGEPVDGGAISFLPDGGGEGLYTASAEITGGKFSLPAAKGPSPGRCRIQIVWNKKTGKKVQAPGDPGNMIDEALQVIPDKYNTKTTLSEEVKAGSNTFTFDLKK